MIIEAALIGVAWVVGRFWPRKNKNNLPAVY